MVTSRLCFPRWLTMRARGIRRWKTMIVISLVVGALLWLDTGSYIGYGTLTSLPRAHNQFQGETFTRALDKFSDLEVTPASQGQKVKVLTSNQTCPGLKVSLTSTRTKYFQTIKGSKSFVYSAYPDFDGVRLVGLRHRHDLRILFCHLWYDDVTGTRDSLSVNMAEVDDIPEDHDRKYSATYIFCRIPKERKGQFPMGVSLATKKCHITSSDLVRVHERGSMTLNFTVCVTPLNRVYNKVHELVEMIEFNRILGADKFAFYNFSIGPLTEKVLGHYQRQGLVDIFQWDLPTRNVHYFGQLASLNDCLHQYRNISRYLVYQDLDEFIIPQGSVTSWSQLVANRKRVKPGAVAFLVRNVFFRREWPRAWSDFPENDKAASFRSVVLQTTFKEAQILPYQHRSKFILDPLRTTIVGIHFPWEIMGPDDKVPPKHALMCHYRNWESPDDPQERLVDETVVQRFGQRIVNSLEKAWRSLERDIGLKSEKIH